MFMYQAEDDGKQFAEPDTNIKGAPTADKSHNLSTNPILLYEVKDEKELPRQPPPTPKELISDCYVTVLPTIPENVRNIPIPYIREVGIKNALDTLAPAFGCDDYKNNLVQFWFLDIIVDCIWRAQDEFRFSMSQQKCVLEWLIFAFTLISNRNIDKTLMFQIFNAAITMAEDYVQSGVSNEPIPEKIFKLNLKSDGIESVSICSSMASTLCSANSKNSVKSKTVEQYIVISYNDGYQVFRLPTKESNIECILSSEDSASEDENEVGEEIKNREVTSSESSLDICKLDISTPPRFKSLQEVNKAGSLDVVSIDSRSTEESSRIVGDWYSIPRQKLVSSCPSKKISEDIQQFAEEQIYEIGDNLLSKVKLEDNTSKASDDHKNPLPKSDEIFKAYFEYNLWQLKQEYMSKSEIGWTSQERFTDAVYLPEEKKNLNTKRRSSQERKQIFINSCIIMAVKQIVFDYFDQNFSYELARISLTNPQFLIMQNINVEWNIAKNIKGDFKKPMPRKPKREKLKKEPKPKVKREKSKESKTKSSKSKGKTRTTSKDKKSKSNKGSKSTKSDKRKKIGKEEKQELDRLKRQQEQLEKELLKTAENKMFMFPLKEAVNEAFFSNLFPDFKPNRRIGRTREKSREKSSKSSKRSKDAKKKPSRK